MPASYPAGTNMTTNRKPKQIHDNDTDLVRKIVAGQTDLFYDLVGRYEQKLYNFGLRLCRDESDSEDLVQETFLNVFKYLNSFRFETKFKNWLYRIATSVCIKKRRKSKYAPERELSLEEFIPSEGEPVPTEVPQWASLPLDQVLNEELSQKIRAATKELPDKYRIVFVLRDIEGFTTEETAQMVDITISNVKVRLHRARLFMREQLKKYFNHE